MRKLVEDPQSVTAFLPKLVLALTKNFENMRDPEAREKTRQDLDTLKRVVAVKDDVTRPQASTAGTIFGAMANASVR